MKKFRIIYQAPLFPLIYKLPMALWFDYVWGLPKYGEWKQTYLTS